MQTIGCEQDRPLACVACADAGEGLRTITISPWGKVESLAGTYVLDEEAATAIAASFEQHGVPLPIDLEHETVDAKVPPGQRTGALGWIESLHAVTGKGLMGAVRWTERGRKLIRSGAFPYLSPVFMVRVDDRRAVALHSAGLTVKPAIPRMERLAASQTTETKAMTTGTVADMGPVIQKIAGLLKIDATGDPATVLQAIFDKLDGWVTDGTLVVASNQGAKTTADRVVANALRTVLGLPADAGETQTLVALGKVCHAAMVEKERVLKLNALVEPYIRKGVLDPHSKYATQRAAAEEMIALAASSPDAFETVMRERVAMAPPWGRTTPPPAGENKKQRATIIRNAVTEFQSDPAHWRITTVQKFVNLALSDAGETTLHSDEMGLVAV